MIGAVSPVVPVDIAPLALPSLQRHTVVHLGITVVAPTMGAKSVLVVTSLIIHWTPLCLLRVRCPVRAQLFLALPPPNPDLHYRNPV